MPKIHLDTDLGGDIDDLCALALLLGWPGVDLVGVTTNSDDQGRRAGYARYALELAGRGDVPVAAGADAAQGFYRVWPGLPEETRYWPEPVSPAAGPLDRALALLDESIAQGAIIAAVGAFTNLALLEQRSPGRLSEANLVLMGGYVYPPRDGFPAWDHEMDWNNQVDVHSAITVLQQADPLLVPLSVTVETALRRADLPKLRRAGSLGQLIARQAEAFAAENHYDVLYGQTCAGLPEDLINFLHDPLACAIALGWQDGVVVSEIPLRTTIENGWLRQRVEGGGKAARVVTQVNGERFNRLWLEMVTRSRPGKRFAERRRVG